MKDGIPFRRPGHAGGPGRVVEVGVGVDDAIRTHQPGATRGRGSRGDRGIAEEVPSAEHSDILSRERA